MEGLVACTGYLSSSKMGGESDTQSAEDSKMPHSVEPSGASLQIYIVGCAFQSLGLQPVKTALIPAAGPDSIDSEAQVLPRVAM